VKPSLYMPQRHTGENASPIIFNLCGRWGKRSASHRNHSSTHIKSTHNPMRSPHGYLAGLHVLNKR
jgi:hypothetical protein